MTDKPTEPLIGASPYVYMDAQGAELRAVKAENVRLRAALEELLDVAERIRGGDSKLNPEQWYATRDYARVVLKRGA